jgi:hypothetical protein
LISKIIEVADICCHGRVVSVLEGGYGKTQKRESERLSSHSDVNSTNNYNLLDKAVFSESVMRHLRALIDPYGIHITCFSFFFKKKDFMIGLTISVYLPLDVSGEILYFYYFQTLKNDTLDTGLMTMTQPMKIKFIKCGLLPTSNPIYLTLVSDERQMGCELMNSTKTYYHIP